MQPPAQSRQPPQQQHPQSPKMPRPEPGARSSQREPAACTSHQQTATRSFETAWSSSQPGATAHNCNAAGQQSEASRGSAHQQSASSYWTALLPGGASRRQQQPATIRGRSRAAQPARSLQPVTVRVAGMPAEATNSRQPAGSGLASSQPPTALHAEDNEWQIASAQDPSMFYKKTEGSRRSC